MKKIEKFVKGATVVLRNVPVKWAALIDPDRPKWGGSQWKVDIMLTEAQAKEFEEVGFNVKTNKDNEKYLCITRKEVTAAGKTQKPPVIRDEHGMIVQERIGNGSICNVKAWCKYWSSPSGQEGLKAYLDEVQIVELFEFSGGESLGALSEDDKAAPTELPF